MNPAATMAAAESAFRPSAMAAFRIERPISETVLIKGADQVLPGLLLFFRVFGTRYLKGTYLI